MRPIADTPVIIAEDDAASRILLRRHLEGAGYAVTECADGQEALEAIRRIGGGVVVADWRMPRLDGLELCRIIREPASAAALRFVYYILLTAHSEKDEIVAGLEAGADDYLTKPYHKQELLARLRAGERIYQLHCELLERQLEVHRVNAEVIKLNRKLGHLAMTDELTGLLNRRAFLARFDELIAHARRSDQPLCCIMFDIDRFKNVNDQHGHHVGDLVLRQTAQATQERIRRYDVLGRLGGEEFCIACPGASLEVAERLAERVRTGVGGLAIETETGIIHPTISLGVAQLGEEQPESEPLIIAADAMLYRAKENGRNQVWSWTADGAGRRAAAETAATT